MDVGFVPLSGVFHQTTRPGLSGLGLYLCCIFILVSPYFPLPELKQYLAFALTLRFSLLSLDLTYIPPEDKEEKNTEMRLQGLAAAPAMVKHVKKVWHGSQHVVVSHVNAPDACQTLRTQLREVVPICQVVAIPLLSELPVFDGHLGMRFWIMSTNEVFHQRLNIKSMGKATPQGKTFFQHMARNGMLPMMGGIRENSAFHLAKMCEAGLCGSLYVWKKIIGEDLAYAFLPTVKNGLHNDLKPKKQKCF
jgi:hypothetical protein